MFRKKRQSQSQRSQTKGPPAAVGTEAVAQRNLERNKVDFRYPSAGFCHPVEHSLIYTMLSSPDIYPASAVQTAIRDEDFREYMLVNTATSRGGGGGDDEPQYSYGQLCALLTLAAEKWPGDQQQQQNQLLWDDGVSRSKDDNVPQVLCRTLLKTVIRHAEAHGLDRESEVQELLEPLQRLTVKKDLQNTGALLLPMYIGMGASMLTANPLPLYLGWMAGSALSMQDAAVLQNQATNLQQLKSTTDRMADVEKTSLLDEEEDDFD